MSYALITGASGGIGFEFAKLLARDGNNLVIVGKDLPRLAESAKKLSADYGVVVHAINQDLTHPEAAQVVYDQVGKLGIKIDVLVNNAGFGLFGVFAETSLQKELEMIQLNITALTALTKLFLPAMITKRKGKILNVASTAAFQPGPLMAVYYASKAYVLHFSEALSNELQGTGVTVTALCPGPTETGFQKQAQLDGSKLFKGSLSGATDVANVGYLGMKNGKPVVIAGCKNKLLATSIRFMPRKAVTQLVRNAQERV